MDIMRLWHISLLRCVVRPFNHCVSPSICIPLIYLDSCLPLVPAIFCCTTLHCGLPAPHAFFQPSILLSTILLPIDSPLHRLPTLPPGLYPTNLEIHTGSSCSCICLPVPFLHLRFHSPNFSFPVLAVLIPLPCMAIDPAYPTRSYSTSSPSASYPPSSSVPSSMASQA